MNRFCRKAVLFAAAIVTICSLSACSTWNKLNHTEKGAVIGTGSGAVVGGAIGGTKGAVLGGAAGGVAGGVIGHNVD
ncbi:MAG: glycine zipper 2TM domain-containing protein [Lentisphaerae bacterium]|nr:glycine zipper 2TM domain-containing protein [Lentisphaerota bacterium]